MAITLAEAKVGMADKVNQQVVDMFRRSSLLLDRLTFDDSISPGTGGSTLTYGYVQLSTPSTAAVRTINSEYVANEAKVGGASGTYVFTYDGDTWTYQGAAATLTQYGVTATGTPASGDTITVTYTAANGGWEALGKDLDDLNKELNPDTDTSQNVLGESRFEHRGYQPSVALDTYYMAPERLMYAHLLDTALQEKYAESDLLGWMAESMFKNCAQKVKANIFDPFIKGFKKAFGIASPSKEMQPYGEFVGEGILEGVKGAFGSVSNWITNNIVDPFKRGFNTAFSVVGNTANALKAKGETIASGIKSGISSGWPSVTTLLSEKAEGVKSLFTSGKFEQMGESVIGGINDGLNKAGIDTGKLVASGEQLVQGLKDGVTGGKWDEMVGKVWQRFDDLTHWFNNEGREGFKQSGEYLIEGLDEGMREKFSITLDTVQNGGQAAVDAFNKAVGISSPSKVMAESGRYFMDGLTQGIEQESSKTFRAVRTVAAGIVDEMDGMEIKPEMDMTTRGLDRVADKLAGIAQIFQTINRAFTDFASVPLPAIVTGAYAPAGTRVTDISGSGLTEIKQLLGRFLDRAAELEEKIDSRPVRVDVHAEIDKREIARATAEVRQDSNNINNGGGRW